MVHKDLDSRAEPETDELEIRGNACVNIHTAGNSGGEIRGQIAPVQFAATLHGANEVPAVAIPQPAPGRSR